MQLVDLYHIPYFGKGTISNRSKKKEEKKKVKKVIVIALGLIVLIAIPVLAQESEKSMEDQMMEIQEKMAVVPNIGVAANVQVKFLDANFNGKKDPEGVHFANGDVNATVTFKGEADGTGMMLGKTTAELKMKFNGAAAGAAAGDAQVLNVVQDGAWLKIAGLMGLPIDITGYALKANATTTLDPVKVGAPGIGLDILAGPLTVKTIFNSTKGTVAYKKDAETAVDDPTLFAGSVNVEFPLPDVVTISGGVSFAQKDPVITHTDATKNVDGSSIALSTLAADKVLDLGIGAKIDLKMVPDLALPISFGVKLLNKANSDTAKADTSEGVTGIKVDVPIVYTLGDLKAKLHIAYATFAWVQGVNSPADSSTTDELKVAPGVEFALADMGITAKLNADIWVMVTSVTEDVGGTKITTVNPKGGSGDYGSHGDGLVILDTGESPGLRLKIVPALDIKTGFVTTTISSTISSDANITKTAAEDQNDATRIGFEIAWKAAF